MVSSRPTGRVVAGFEGADPSGLQSETTYQDAAGGDRPRAKRLSGGVPHWVNRELWKGLPPTTPGYVLNCVSNPFRSATNLLYIWRRDDPNSKTRMGAHCQSWRCPDCQVQESHVFYARMQEAFEQIPASECVFLVLTLDAPLHHEARRKGDVRPLYADFGKRWQRYRQRLDRWLIREGMGPIQSEWVRTVEQHQSGVPHLNVLIHAPALAARLRRENQALIDTAGFDESAVRLIRGEVKRHADECGFGWSSTLEPVSRELSRLWSYLAKNAKNAENVAGELAKISQLPVKAPKRLRRYAAGRGFLPPRRKDPNVTGCIVHRRTSPEGDDVIVPLQLPKDPEAAAEALRVCAYESGLMLMRDGGRPGPKPEDYQPEKHWVPRPRAQGPPLEGQQARASPELAAQVLIPGFG